MPSPEPGPELPQTPGPHHPPGLRPDLRVTLVQTPLAWEDPAANRAAFGSRLAELAGRTDLVVLPEMFTTGFTMRSGDLAEAMHGPTVEWLRDQSKRIGAAFYGSVIIGEEDRFLNRGIFATPDGRILWYDKRHLFRMAGEDAAYAPGDRRVVVEWRGWRLLLQVCYDLRFPVFSRSCGDYDVLLYVANWPGARRLAWSRLLPARAIENLAYCIGVNRVGTDGAGIGYSGDSVALDPQGTEIPPAEGSPPDPGGEAIWTVVLDGSALDAYRTRFPAHLDADPFRLPGIG